MSNGIREYKIGYSRLARGLLEGFTLTSEGALCTQDGCQQHRAILAALDSAQADCPWGRLTFRAQVEGEVVLTVRAYASNEPALMDGSRLLEVDEFLLDPGQGARRKAKLFEAAGGIRQVGSSDLLLLGQKGRYLWLWLEVTGTGTAQLDHLRVLVPGDNFYRTLPALYQNNQPDDAFLHRYLAIFSSLYNDLQDTVDGLSRYLDLDTAPAEALPLFADWLGLELDGNFLDEGSLRALLKIAPQLIAAKGTRRAIELVAGLFVKEPVYLIERNLLDRTQLSTSSALYGQTPYDFTLLIPRTSDELLHARLRFLVDQFKPLRSRAHIVFLGDEGELDAFSYLDLNGKILQVGTGSMDDGQSYTGMTCLE